MRSSASLTNRMSWHVRDLLNLGLPYQLRHLHRFGKHPFRVRVKDIGEFVLRPKTADAAVVSQVFSWREYDTRQFPQHTRINRIYEGILARNHRPLILDLGANIGAATRWFAHEYPKASIVAVEPDPENAYICQLNTSGYAVQVETAAVGGAPGAISLDTNGKGSMSYTATRSGDGDVPIVTIDQMLSTRRVDHELFIVKVDIEGFEDDLFAANTEWVREAQVIIIEPHDFKFPDRNTSRYLQETMGRLPFQILISGENLIYVRHDTPMA